jgi:hypothetical protein
MALNNGREDKNAISTLHRMVSSKSPGSSNKNLKEDWPRSVGSEAGFGPDEPQLRQLTQSLVKEM